MEDYDFVFKKWLVKHSDMNANYFDVSSAIKRGARTMEKKKPKHIVVVYKPTLIDSIPDIIGFFRCHSEDRANFLIKDFKLKRKAKCYEYDDNEEVQAVVYYCEE